VSRSVAPRKSAIKHDRDGFVRCRVCGCTERDACDPPCEWVEDDLCSGCAEAAEMLARWKEGARRTNFAALMRETQRRLDIVS
jgi:hypothetical protein